MRLYRCDKCFVAHPHRKKKKRNGDIVELMEVWTHSDGSKDSMVYGKYNEKTNEIIEFKAI